MLWLALRVPELPLAIFERARAEQTPFAVAEGRRILLANERARAAGVHSGMALSAAQALAPKLSFQSRRIDQETAALRRLADWALQYSPLVSLQPPMGLLIEIGGSLKLFGGLHPLLESLEQGLAELGYGARIAVAPFPTAAWLLNLGDDPAPASSVEEIVERLRVLSIEVLELEARAREALLGLGISRVGELLQLPRDGLARRLDPQLLVLLDRALGRIPDPRRPYLPKPRFESLLELSAEIESSTALLFPLRRQLLELGGFLRGLDSGIETVDIELRHARAPATVLSLGLARPSRDPAHLLELAKQRLERLRLAAPVRAIRLQADRIGAYQAEAPTLFEDGSAPANPWTQLVERLCARIGDDAILGLRTVSEHRPERAWNYAPPGEQAPALAQSERPLWLLPQPERLGCNHGQPQWHGPLILCEGPERIESGWWDGHDIRRDYYVARNAEGARLWVFQEQRTHEWFLHGLFS